MKKLILPLLFVLGLPFSASAQQLVNGTISAAGSDCTTATRCVIVDSLTNIPSFGIALTLSNTATVVFEATIDNSTWFSVTEDVGSTTSTTATGRFYFTNIGYRAIRFRASAISGTVAIIAHKGFSGMRTTASLSGGGDATAANQTTLIGHVDGIEALLSTSNTNTGVIAGDTTDIETAIELLDNIVSVEDAVAGSAFSGVGILAVRQDSYVDLAADGDFIPLTIDADGGLRVSIVAGAGSGGTAIADDADVTAGTTSFTPIGGFYQSSVTACTDTDGCIAGLTTGRALKVHLSAADGSTQTLSVDVVEDAAETAGVSGPMILSVRRDTPASSAGTTGDNATVNTDENGSLYTTPISTNAGGASSLKYTSVGTTEDEHAVCTGPCNLYSITVTNTNAAVRFIRCENDTTANTIPGSETVELDLAIPAATTGAGFSISFPVGSFFSTALTCWAVTGVADTDVAEVAANEIKIFYTFKI